MVAPFGRFAGLVVALAGLAHAILLVVREIEALAGA